MSKERIDEYKEALSFEMRQNIKLKTRIKEMKRTIRWINEDKDWLKEENKRHREALKFYANKDIYKLVNNGLTARVPIIYDCGKVANEVLKEESE